MKINEIKLSIYVLAGAVASVAGVMISLVNRAEADAPCSPVACPYGSILQDGRCISQFERQSGAQGASQGATQGSSQGASQGCQGVGGK